MANIYATVNDVIALWRPLDEKELGITSQLLSIVSAGIRQEAAKRGYNFDELIDGNEDLQLIAKSVVVDVIKRHICDNSEDSPAFSQVTQSAGGYSFSGSPLNPSKGVVILKNDLKRLGIMRPKMRGVDL